MAGNRRTKIPRKAQRARNRKYKFSDKKHPAEGIVSFGMGVTALILTIVSVFLSEQAMGQGGMIVGALGTVAMVLSLVGALLSLYSFKKKEIHYQFPILGGVINSILLFFLLVLYVLGAVEM